jgi:tRNA-Thr(GGU) m(6)t(6)A37 methyltransferase TsaA
MNQDWEQPVTIRPIGVVISPLKEFDQTPSYGEEACLFIREDLTDALQGLEHFSHLHVVYRQHRREEWKRRDLIPEGKDKLLEPVAIEPVCKGIYTSRSPARPSGMGSCIVELMRHEGNKLYVKGLDAIDGTPLLDLKIYIPKYDCFPWAEAPLHWCQKNTMTTTSRLLHWDTMNVSLTLGMRAGQRAMRELGATRACGAKAAVRGGGFFAQGVEAVTGCSPLHGEMQFEDKPKKPAEWFVRLEFEGRSVEIKIKDQLYAGADEVLSLPDEHLFAACTVAPAAGA